MMSLRIAAGFACFALCTGTLANKANAQSAGPKIGCSDRDARQLADEVKQHYQMQGFAPMRDAMIGMTPGMPLPIVISLVAGTNYQVVFVGNSKAKRMEAEVMDAAQKQEYYKQLRPKADNSRVIEFPFRAARTDAYLFIVKQFTKRDETCGSFTILRDTLKNRVTPVTQYTR